MPSESEPIQSPDTSRTIQAVKPLGTGIVTAKVRLITSSGSLSILLDEAGTRELERQLRRLRKGPKQARSETGRVVRVQAGTRAVNLNTPGYATETLPPAEARRLARRLKEAADAAEEAGK